MNYDNDYTLWSLPQFQISVIPALVPAWSGIGPKSFREDSRRASLAEGHGKRLLCSGKVKRTMKDAVLERHRIRRQTGFS